MRRVLSRWIRRVVAPTGDPIPAPLTTRPPPFFDRPSKMPFTHPLSRRLAAIVDPGLPEPIAHQIVECVWTEVVDGSLETGERMPTAREIAIELGVSPRSVAWAYGELERLGVLSSRSGEGTFVSLAPPPEEERERRRQFLALCAETVERARALGFGPDGDANLPLAYSASSTIVVPARARPVT